MEKASTKQEILERLKGELPNLEKRFGVAKRVRSCNRALALLRILCGSAPRPLRSSFSSGGEHGIQFREQDLQLAYSFLVTKYLVTPSWNREYREDQFQFLRACPPRMSFSPLIIPCRPKRSLH